MTEYSPTEGIYIEYMPLSELVRAPRNPKDHDLGELGRSFERFGFTSPVLRDERTGRLVAGHGRLDGLQARKSRGKEAPDRIIVRGDGQWMIPVIRGVSFKDDAEAEAYLIADNQLTTLGGWNEAELTRMLADLAASGPEMLRGVGFDHEDLDKMLEKMLPSEKTETEIIPEQYAIMVSCQDEQEQAELLERFIEEGLQCRALIS